MSMMKKNSEDAKIFDFDPNHINWEDYFSNVHIPGVLKYVCKWTNTNAPFMFQYHTLLVYELFGS